MKKITLLLILMITTLGFSQNNVTVSGTAAWTGYANVFDLDGNYQFGSGWGLADIKTVVTPSTNTVTLSPNFNAYTNALNGNANDIAYWTNGAGLGNKIFEGNSFIENSTLAGQILTFTGNVTSNTLASGYTAVAFIKGLNPATGYSADVNVSVPLVSGQPFSVTTTTAIPAGLIVQYGFTIKGLNGNPANEAALGNVVVTATSTSTPTNTDVTFKVDMSNYTNLGTGVVNVAGSFNGWSDANPLTQEGTTNIWSGVVSIPQSTIEYKFIIGNWSADESLAAGSSCTITTGPYTNRLLVVGATPIVNPVVCWASCSACSTSPTLTQMSLPVTFDATTVEYGVIGFEGAQNSTIEVDPTLSSNKVVKVVKSAIAQPWAGTTVTAAAELGFSPAIPLTVTDSKMNVRVWSPDAGIQVRLKVEDHSNGAVSVETEATTTVANGWQTLEFNFNNQASGTAAFNASSVYDKASIFFNFGVNGATAGEKTYYFDDVQFGAIPVVLTQMSLPVTFDATTVEYGVIGFEGAQNSTIEVDPTLSSNKVVKVVKSATAQPWAGTTVTAAAELGFSPAIPLTVTDSKMNVRVWSPDAGIQVRLKVEDHSNGAVSVETEATTTVANGWQTLEFNFNNQASGTAAFNASSVYDKASIFFNFGVNGATAGEKTYYFDDVQFGAIPVVLTQMSLPVTFDATTVEYGVIGFEGAQNSTIEVDPTLSSNKVVKVVKSATAQPWAGTTVTAAAELGFSPAIPLTVTDSKMNVRVWSPDAGIQVRLKVEDHSNGAVSVETEATTTVANGWQTLEFNFNNQASGTAAFNASSVYDKASIFFNFGVNGATAGEKTYYFDDVQFGAIPVVLTQMSLPVTFDATTVEYGVIGFEGAQNSTIEVDPTLSSNKVVKVVKSATAQPWAGTTVTAAAELGFSPAIPLTVTDSKMNVRVWSPDAGIQVRLKVEDHSNGAVSVETEATTTVANGWQTLEFNFNNQASGTAAFNASSVYDKASIFFNFGVNGATAGEKTYYFDDVQFGAALGVNTFNTPKVRIYPNPTSGIVTIEANSVIESITVYNVLGQEMLSQKGNSASETLNISNFKSGVYLVRTTSNGKTATSRIVKE